MKRRTIMSVAVALAMASTSFLFAQDAGNPPTPPTPAQMVARQVAHLTTVLSLTAAQQTQATTIFTTEQASMPAIFTSLKTARTALETAVESNDASGITTASAEIGTLSGQQTEIRAKAQAAFFAILTADQQTKFKALHTGGPHGPGGFGGPGFGGPGPGPGGQL